MDRADWAPSPADVGSVIRARTKDVHGNEPGTFNSATRPTGDEVADYIDSIVSEISGDLGDIPDRLQDYARRTAAIGAAAEVELSHWPEQNSGQNSVYALLNARYEKRLAKLKAGVEEANNGDLPGTDDEQLPVFGFPMNPPCGPEYFTSWNTRF